MDADAQVNPLSNINFATEVKSDRLRILWKVTAAACGLVLLFSAALVQLLEFSFLVFVLAPMVMVIFCLVTRYVLNGDNFEAAAIIYTLGGLVFVAVTLLDGNPTIAQITPFFLVVVIFIGGLLLSPSTTFIMAGIAALMTLLLPVLVADKIGRAHV